MIPSILSLLAVLVFVCALFAALCGLAWFHGKLSRSYWKRRNRTVNGQRYEQRWWA